MPFAAVTKNIKSTAAVIMRGCSSKAEAMPRKSMVQGYKTSNSTGTGLKERRMRNPVL